MFRQVYCCRTWYFLLSHFHKICKIKTNVSPRKFLLHKNCRQIHPAASLFFEKSSPPLYSSDSFYMNRIFTFFKSISNMISITHPSYGK